MTDRSSVFIAAPFPSLLFDLLRGDGRFDVSHAPCESGPDLASRIGASRILVTRYHNRVTREVVDRAEKLELIVQGTSGLDNIDHVAATARGIRVVGVPGVNANAVAELVIGHMIALTRTVGTYSWSVREGQWNRDDCATRREMRAHRLGIVGLGRVGTCVARLSAAFGIEVAAFDPYITDRDFDERGAARAESLGDLLESSDVLTLHVPLNEETRGMIGEKEIAVLPGGAILINCSRGAVLDVHALLGALEENRLGGAALDVFDPEPPAGIRWPADPRLILTPHIAGCTREAKESVARMVFEAIVEEIDRASEVSRLL